MNQQPRINVSLKDTIEITCEKCGYKIFEQAFLMRKVPAIYTGEETIMPISVFQCCGCGHINKDFLPVEMTEPEKPTLLL